MAMPVPKLSKKRSDVKQYNYLLTSAEVHTGNTAIQWC